MSGSLEQSRRLSDQLELMVEHLTDFTERLREQFAVERDAEEEVNGDEPAERT